VASFATAFSRCEGVGAGVRPEYRDGARGAGGRGAATGEPPQMGTSGSQRRGFRRTQAGAGGVPAVGGRGGVLVPQKWPVTAVSALFGGGLESHRNPLKSVGTALGWCGVGRSPPCTGQVCERKSAQKRPGSTPNPESGSEIGIVKASSSLAITLAILTPTRPPKYLHAAPGDVRRSAHIRVNAVLLCLLLLTDFVCRHPVLPDHTHTHNAINLAILTPIRHQTACLQILVMIVALCMPAWPPLPYCV
jgi:hypothetical protein